MGDDSVTNAVSDIQLANNTKLRLHGNFGTSLELGQEGKLLVDNSFIIMGVADDPSAMNTVIVDNKIFRNYGSFTIGDRNHSAATGEIYVARGSLLEAVGAMIHSPILTIDGTFKASGSFFGMIRGSGHLDIIGDFEIYNQGGFQGLAYDGPINVGSHRLKIESLGFTHIDHSIGIYGGIIDAKGGLVFGPGAGLIGHGYISAPVAASLGSMIVPDDDLVIGESDSYDGFYSDGNLIIGMHKVTVHDKNEAVLGHFD